jgi:ribosome-associated protein
MAKTESAERSRPVRRRKTAKATKSAGLPKAIEVAVRAAEDKKAENIAVLDLRDANGFTDYFVICTGTNSRQIRAIADGITDAIAEAGAKPNHVEGYDRSEWVLVDYFDFIVHVFSPDARAFYGLERLWGSAEPVEIPPAH